MIPQVPLFGGAWGICGQSPEETAGTPSGLFDVVNVSV
jgi:hypothetical protein